MAEYEDAADKKDDKAKLQQALDRFKSCESSPSEIANRALELEDREFFGGDQWPQDIKNQRRAEGRPCHVMNRMGTIARQVTNAQRQNRASAKVSPVDDKGDIKTAEIIQGGVRHIEYDSNADGAYMTAGFDAAVSGRGYWRLVTGIRNPFTVYLDPNAQEPDGSDARFGFVITTLTEDEFKQQFPGKALPKEADWDSTLYPGWCDFREKTYRIAEYYYQELEPDTLYTMADGSLRLKSQLGSEPKEGEYIDERETQIPTMKLCRITATDILEETDLPGSGRWIPIIRVIGEELDLNGKVIYSGVIRQAKDAQREFNYMRSKRTEAIALAPAAPYILIAGQVEGHEAMWAQANNPKLPYLVVNGLDLQGCPAPAPTRANYEAPIAALTQASLEASDDMKATTGVYDAQVGAKSNETSGRAINARVGQGETSNFHFVDNLVSSIGHSTRIIVDWMPDVYDTKRFMRIIGEDDTHTMATVLGSAIDPEKRVAMVEQGKAAGQKIYDISVGTYDVICSAGKSFSTKRQEAAELLTNLASSAPILMQAAPDLVMKSLDIPYSTEIAERMKKLLPPELQDKQDGQTQVPPEVEQKMAQLTQMNQQLTEAVNQLSAERENKKAELESRERMNTENNEVKLFIAESTAHNAAAMELMRAEFQKIHAALTHSQSLEMQASAPEPEAPQAGA